MKKCMAITALLLVLSLLFSVAAFGAEAAEPADGAPLNYLLMGDSIAEGFGVLNPSEASYGAIVAATNGYAYHNIARYARTTGGQLRQIETDADARAEIAQADIISLSIGGNDYFADSSVVIVAAGLVLDLPTRSYTQLTAQMIENFAVIIDKIYELNPDVTLLVQTLANTWYGPLGRGYRRGTDTVNQMIFDYLAAYPGAYEIVDVDGALTGHKELIATDTIHPNAAGNVAIARVVLQKLQTLGLGAATEPVIPAPGVEYNFFVQEYGAVLGRIFTVLVRFFTGYMF